MNIEIPELRIHDAVSLKAMIDPAWTALLVIDVQVDFVAPDGFFGRAGADLSTIEPAIDAMERSISAARAAGMTIVFVRAIDPSAGSLAMKRFQERRGMTASGAICRSGERGADYHRIRPHADDIELAKNSYDAFHETNLTTILRRRGIEAVVVMGVATDCCVDSTARSAFLRDFDVFIVSDACAAGAPYLHFGALTALAQNAATLTTSEALVAALANPDADGAPAVAGRIV